MEGVGKGFLSFPLHPDQLWGQPTYLCNGYCGSFFFFSGVKHLLHGDDHSYPSNAEVKNGWSYTSNSLCVLTAL
jgi:hypothetical protein